VKGPLGVSKYFLVIGIIGKTKVFLLLRLEAAVIFFQPLELKREEE